MIVTRGAVLLTGPDNQMREPVELLESVRSQLWMQMKKTLIEPTSPEGQRKYHDYERAKDIVAATLDLISAEKALQWLTCEASYYRINLALTDEDIESLQINYQRNAETLKARRVEFDSKTISLD